MKPIFLIGYMGAGKTSVGRALAHRYGLEHIDLDWRIEQRFHHKISDMFATIGEEGFRIRERNMLHEVMGMENVVVSVGGGTPCFFDNMEQMNVEGHTIYLQCSVDVLVKRIMRSQNKRPIVANKTKEELMNFVAKHLAEREAFYMQANEVWNGEELRVENLHTPQSFGQLP
jgi:shikimate kinase